MASNLLKSSQKQKNDQQQQQHGIHPKTVLPSGDANAALARQQQELINYDLEILNHCFDDIETFLSRLQIASSYFKELQQRKTRILPFGKKQNSSNNGLLNVRAKLPHQQDYYDIFQKFKLAFNLLGKLKYYIQSPNAPELVHFLFTPFAIIINSSKNVQPNKDLIKNVLTPVISKAAVDLLLNCLTSKEQALWQSLGTAWSVSFDDQRNNYIEPYRPIFYDGWIPNLEKSEPYSINPPQLASDLQSQNQTKMQQQQQNLQSKQNSNAPNTGIYSEANAKLISLAQNLNQEVKEWADNSIVKGSK